MTCIVGLVDDDVTYLGGDAAASRDGGWTQTIIANPKIFTIGNGEFLLGVAGLPRLAQLMQYAFYPPAHDERLMTPTQYMVTAFVDAMRQAVWAGGIEIVHSGQEVVNGHLLIAYRGGLFVVDEAFDIEEAAAPFHAIGSGAQAALGALYATQGRDSFERVTCALDAAEHINTTVRRPFRVLCHYQRRRIVEVIDYTVDECYPVGDVAASETGTGDAAAPAA